MLDFIIPFHLIQLLDSLFILRVFILLQTNKLSLSLVNEHDLAPFSKSRFVPRKVNVFEIQPTNLKKEAENKN